MLEQDFTENRYRDFDEFEFDEFVEPLLQHEMANWSKLCPERRLYHVIYRALAMEDGDDPYWCYIPDKGFSKNTVLDYVKMDCAKSQIIEP